MKFELTDEQVKEFETWRKTHKREYTGAIGGRYQFRFRPTGMGVCVTVEDGVTGETIDLTDEGSW